MDSGFYYLVRLHFCEIVPGVNGANERVFNVFLNNQTADEEADGPLSGVEALEFLCIETTLCI